MYASSQLKLTNSEDYAKHKNQQIESTPTIQSFLQSNPSLAFLVGNKVKTIKGFNDKIKHLITGYQKDIENLKAKRPGLQDLSELDGVLEDLQVALNFWNDH